MSEKIILELIAGEGGSDSKLFLTDMVKMYEGYCKAENINSECL
jgi:protein subunit release factor A